MTVQIKDLPGGVAVGPLEASIDVAAVESRGSQVYSEFFKRVFDVVLVVIALPIWAPLLLLSIAALIFSGQSPFYTQLRIGKNGRHFRIFKLCTMVPNADAVLEEYLKQNPKARDEWATTQKLKNDPRVTAMGRFLRKSSLDELPQLLNVLLGQMSLVGPRPMLLCQAELYPGRSYFELRPGITGNWQISDRNECAFRDRAAYDDVYFRDISFKTDLSILMRTVSVVVRGTGY